MTTKIDHLKHLAMEYADKLIMNEEDEEIRKNTDRTKEFYAAMEKKIIGKGLINQTINGQVRDGKSTVTMAIAKHANDLLIKHHKTKIPFGMYHIARDQQESSKKHREKDRNNTVLVIDEWNTGEEGGENVTAEKALADVFSDIHAGRYIHKFNVSPKYVHDKNSDVILEVIGKNVKEKTTMCYLYYKLYQGGRESQELLGYVNIYVGDIINNWVNIEETFLQQQATGKISQDIIDLAQQDFYVEYMIKKYEKMDLITKEGIMQPRMLDYADIILKIVDSMKILARMKSGLTSGLIRNNVKTEFRRMKLPLTTFGQALIVEEIMGILSLYKSQTSLRKEINYYRNKKQINAWDLEEQKKLVEELNKIGSTITETINDYEKMVAINKKYHERL